MGIRDPRSPDQQRETSDRLDRAGRERDRRHAQETVAGRLAEDLRTKLFGDQRFPGDDGILGQMRSEIRELRRQNRWILGLLFTGLVAFVVDVLVRVVH